MHPFCTVWMVNDFSIFAKIHVHHNCQSVENYCCCVYTWLDSAMNFSCEKRWIRLHRLEAVQFCIKKHTYNAHKHTPSKLLANKKELSVERILFSHGNSIFFMIFFFLLYTPMFMCFFSLLHWFCCFSQLHLCSHRRCLYLGLHCLILRSRTFVNILHTIKLYALER